MEEIDLYLRKSKVVREEDARDLTSVITQEELGRRWAERNNYKVRHVWVDNLSAWSDGIRPEFDGALGAIMLGEVKALWCFALDRFSRKGIDEIGPVLGRARVIFDYEGLDSSVERDRRWITDRAEQAREYSQRLSYNIRTTKASQKDRGKWLGKAPYGLEINNSKERKLVHSPDWPVIEHIISEVADSATSGRQLCIRLNKEGIPSPSGGKWQSSTVSRILNNPVYEGWQVTNQRGAPGNATVYRNASGDRVRVLAEGVEPIAHDALARARAVLAGHLVMPPRTGEPRRKHLLTGLTRCAGCKGALPCEGRSHVCSSHKIGKGCPSPTSVLRTALELYVRDAWVARLSAADDDDPLLVAVAERYAALTEPKTSEDAHEVIAAVRTAEAGIQRLVDQMAAGMFDPPFDKHLPRLQEEARAALIIAKARAAKLAPQRVDITFLRDADMAQMAWDGAAPEMRRELARLAIRQIFVSKATGHCKGFDGDARVTIIWHDGER
ncbi:recombinase family protein [Streptomyces sp. NBC_00503]|uniref:recombinase family protein n=1 Tax=Streptomyces sp. NBC_00503 TaxID=2903659 RepID=UPI002E822EB8|nr:recombinase family protein [Streptomyces sp. NBC_00503]WUD84973.1 recombinase family protein [Streptomyces sp. NBC_00503]